MSERRHRRECVPPALERQNAFSVVRIAKEGRRKARRLVMDVDDLFLYARTMRGGEESHLFLSLRSNHHWRLTGTFVPEVEVDRSSHPFP
jgi:hypothetical protein